MFGFSAWLIHGTNITQNPNPENTWSEEFKDYLDSDVLNDSEEVFVTKWSGGNDMQSRDEAAENIAAEIMLYHESNSDDPIRLIGHSHGGNVAIMVANILAESGIQVETLVTIATPVREYQLKDSAMVGQHINVYNEHDQIQIRGGSLLKFSISVCIMGVISGAFKATASRKFENENVTNIDAEAGGTWNEPIYSHSSMHSNVDIWKKYITPKLQLKEDELVVE